LRLRRDPAASRTLRRGRRLDVHDFKQSRRTPTAVHCIQGCRLDHPGSRVRRNVTPHGSADQPVGALTTIKQIHKNKTMNTKKCPSCESSLDTTLMICGACGWQFSSPTLSATSSATLAGRVQTLARGVTRPNWICSNACQLAVLVRDKSGSMKGQKARDASGASLDLVKVLADQSNKDGFYCAVVDFDSTARIIHPGTKAT